MKLDQPQAESHREEPRGAVTERKVKNNYVMTREYCPSGFGVVGSSAVGGEVSRKMFGTGLAIGKGGFGKVWKVEMKKSKQVFAMKQMSKVKVICKKSVASVMNERRHLARLQHPFLVNMSYAFQDREYLYLIMDYLDGGDLRYHLGNRQLFNEKCTKFFLCNILLCLEYLHRNRIIHRDLKPENIMFRKDNTCDLAICDFGLATYADEEKYLFVRCGTPGFVAPEIINIRDMGTKSEPVSDIFSAGVIFHHLLFGCSVFEGKKYNEILSQNRSCDFNMGKEMYTKLSPKILDLLSKMLEKDPLRRITADAALNHVYFSG